MSTQVPCLCPPGTYLPSCPYTFEQGGGMFHCHGGNLQAVSAPSRVSPWNSDTDSESSQLIDEFVHDLTESNNRMPSVRPARDPADAPGASVHTILGNRSNRQPDDTRWNGLRAPAGVKIDDAAQVFLEQNRINLKKFDALQINGQSLTDYSIGGFKIDVPKTSEVVRKIAPLPPSALPKIFIDDNLNFFHHFFKGIEKLLGVELFQEIIASRFHHDDSRGDLASSLSGFMESGMVATDNALTMFVKKVLSSTFETSTIEEGKGDITVLLVATNLWGFRYIEPGMHLKDVEIRMWLGVCFNHYRTLWFDTFKSSGVPSFAVEGVLLDHSNALLKIESSKRTVIRENRHQLESAREDFNRSLERNNDYLDDMDRRNPRKHKRSTPKQKKALTWF